MQVYWKVSSEFRAHSGCGLNGPNSLTDGDEISSSRTLGLQVNAYRGLFSRNRATGT
jgi:hypothetical protein